MKISLDSDGLFRRSSSRDRVPTEGFRCTRKRSTPSSQPTPKISRDWLNTVSFRRVDPYTVTGEFRYRGTKTSEFTQGGIEGWADALHHGNRFGFQHDAVGLRARDYLTIVEHRR